MIEFLIACSPPPDGSNFTCPPHDGVVECQAIGCVKDYPDPISSVSKNIPGVHPYATFYKVPLFRYEWD
jgi:hypothetical protein|tara:strand:+ start:93 stop:299 length:207 start_codon:yes stop_codon:yes gene_type:complete